VRGQVLQRQLVFLGAAFGFAAMRYVLEDHGVNAAGAVFQVGDRELDVTPFSFAAQYLRRALSAGSSRSLPGARENRACRRWSRRRGAAFRRATAPTRPLSLRIRVEDATRGGDRRARCPEAAAFENGAVAASR
jgi:hypothetical protein